MKIIYSFFLIFSLVSCNTIQRNNVHPIQRIENYNKNTDLSIEERLLIVSPIIINLLNDMDNVDNYSSYELDYDEKTLFMDYYALLPPKFKNIIFEKVLGIYFIENYLGGGMTLPIFSNNGDMYMVIFFNPEILHQDISKWINYRDNSIFANTDSSISVSIEISSEYRALIHTLFHETCHVYDFYKFVTPVRNRKIIPTEFINNVWNNFDEPIKEYNFTERNSLSFYDQGERIDKAYALNIFMALIDTPFSSLYGSTTWLEDFAETFTWYFLNNYYGIKYTTKLFKNDELILSYDPNDNELVRRRYKIFEEIIE
jgi:hypothetical protein